VPNSDASLFDAAVLRDYGGTIIFAVVVALIIRFFLVEAYRIPSSAMHPTLEPGDTIFVSKWPFGLRVPGIEEPLSGARKPRLGEVVVFTLPDDSRRDYVKRVVAFEGSVVEVKGGHLSVDGVPTEVPESRKANCAEERIRGKNGESVTYPVCFETPSIEEFGPTTVPNGSMFLLGDLRAPTPHERGSEVPIKSWGIQPLSALRGSALWIWLSIEPQAAGVSSGWFPDFRFDRMFRRIQ
jgi:signal peptidase I